VNLLGDDIKVEISLLSLWWYHKENMETLIDASKEVGLEVNTDKTK
jgi:hypothetical protein